MSSQLPQPSVLALKSVSFYRLSFSIVAEKGILN